MEDLHRHVAKVKVILLNSLGERCVCLFIFEIVEFFTSCIGSDTDFDRCTFRLGAGLVFFQAAFNIALRNSIADIVEFWALRLFAVKTLLFTICVHRRWNAIATAAAAAVGTRVNASQMVERESTMAECY